jgi:hypothetical protein
MAPPTAQQAAIRTRAGATVAGNIPELLLLKRSVTEPQRGVAYLVVEGAAVRRIDEKGVQLAPKTLVRAFFAAGPGGPIPDLGLPWRFLQSMGPALRDNPQFVANIGCCALSTIVVDVLTDELLGQFQPDSANAQVVPSVQVVAGSSKTEVPVADIVTLKR